MPALLLVPLLADPIGMAGCCFIFTSLISSERQAFFFDDFIISFYVFISEFPVHDFSRFAWGLEPRPFFMWVSFLRSGAI